MNDNERGHCLGCGTDLNYLDDDPNGDHNCICARCRAEENHDFDREPNVKFNRDGSRVNQPMKKSNCEYANDNGNTQQKFHPCSNCGLGIKQFLRSKCPYFALILKVEELQKELISFQNERSEKMHEEGRARFIG